MRQAEHDETSATYYILHLPLSLSIACEIVQARCINIDRTIAHCSVLHFQALFIAISLLILSIEFAYPQVHQGHSTRLSTPILLTVKYLTPL